MIELNFEIGNTNMGCIDVELGLLTGNTDKLARACTMSCQPGRDVTTHNVAILLLQWQQSKMLIAPINDVQVFIYYRGLNKTRALIHRQMGLRSLKGKIFFY